MAWRFFVERFPTSDFSGSTPRITQQITMSENIHLRGVRTWIHKHNSPVFTTLELRVYSNIGTNTLGTLIATASTTWTPSQISSYAHATKEIYFLFNSALPLLGGDSYHFALWTNGYTGDADSFLGWVKGFPDPLNESGLTVNPTNLGELPFKIALFGGAA